MGRPRPWATRVLVLAIIALAAPAFVQGTDLTEAWEEAWSERDAATDDGANDLSDGAGDGGAGSQGDSGGDGGSSDDGTSASAWGGGGTDGGANDSSDGAGDGGAGSQGGSDGGGGSNDDGTSTWGGGGTDDGANDSEPEQGVTLESERSNEQGPALLAGPGPPGTGAESGLMPVWFPSPAILAFSAMLVLSVGMLSTMAITILASEAGRFGLVLAVIAPLAAIASRGDPGQFTRGRVLGYVEAHPGIHFSAVRDALGLANGVTAHHLYRLERHGALISWVDGRRRRFAAAGVDPARLKELRRPVTGMQRAILELLAEAGDLGLSGGELQTRLASSRQLFSYHIQRLHTDALIDADGRGRSRRWMLQEDGVRRLVASRGLER